MAEYPPDGLAQPNLDTHHLATKVASLVDSKIRCRRAAGFPCCTCCQQLVDSKKIRCCCAAGRLTAAHPVGSSLRAGHASKPMATPGSSPETTLPWPGLLSVAELDSSGNFPDLALQ